METILVFLFLQDISYHFGDIQIQIVIIKKFTENQIPIYHIVWCCLLEVTTQKNIGKTVQDFNFKNKAKK